MDQYVIEFDMAMLYFDMLELIDVMEKNEQLKDYTDYLKKVIKDELGE